MSLIYDVTVICKGKELITLDLTDSYKNDPRILKIQSSKTEYEVLIDLSDVMNFGDDAVEFEVIYKKNDRKLNIVFVSPTLELDFATAYIDNGKLLSDCEIMEKKIRLADQGQETIHFEYLSAKTKERDRWRRKV